MNKVIRVSTGFEVTEHEWPEGSLGEQNEFIRERIGDDCHIYTVVHPKRLYLNLGMKHRPTRIPGEAVCMLVDDNGRLKAHPDENYVASYLYQTDLHGAPIAGNVLFVGMRVDDDGEIGFCGLENRVFKELIKELSNMAYAMERFLFIKTQEGAAK